ENAYANKLKKIHYANKQLSEVREKLERYNADLKMTAAEAEIARIAGDLNFDVTTDFGQIEQIIQQKIDTNRGKVRVAADLSSRGVADIKAKEHMESQLAEDVLQQYEVELGLKSPETTPVVDSNKNLGPATDKNTWLHLRRAESPGRSFTSCCWRWWPASSGSACTVSAARKAASAR